MNYTLITGASGGIGEVFARQLAADGKNLILLARSQDRLTRLAAELSQKHAVQVEIITKDLSKVGSAQEVFETCERAGWSVDCLINNAGVGLFGNLIEQEASKIDEMNILNVVSLVSLTRLFLPAMKERKSGGIIFVASTAAFQPIPLFAAYAASKAYVLSFSEAIHEEATAFGVKVMALCPGPTETEFFSRAEKLSGVKGHVKSPMQTSQEVVRFALAKYRSGARVAIPGMLNKMGAVSTRFVPRSIVTKIAEKMIKTGTGI